MQVRQEILSIEKIYNFEMFHKLRNYQITNWQILLSGMQKITISVKFERDVKKLMYFTSQFNLI